MAWIPLPITSGKTKAESSTPVTPTPRDTLEKTSTNAADQKFANAALDSLLPIVYGSRPVPALVANVFSMGNEWVFWLLWCEGEVHSIQVLLNDAPVSNDVTVESYTGTQNQTVNSVLVAAFANYSPAMTFTETMPGVAYSVVRVPHRLITGQPKFTANINGRKIYDPRTTLTAYSRNPALQAADYITNTTFGAGLQVDWASVEAAADANDAILGVAPNPTDTSRLSDMIIDKESSADNYIDSFRAVANVFFVNNQGTVKFIIDADGAPVASYSHDAGNIIDLTGIEMASPQSLPTVIDIVYTDKSVSPWKDATQTYKRPFVDEGITPWRFSSVPMRWITSQTQARREAYERGNKLWLRSLKFDLHVFDEGLVHEPGDIISVTWPDAGFTDFKARITSVAPTAQGWMLGCVKEDSGAYNSSIVVDDPSPITVLPLPSNPPVVTGVTATEELYQQKDGTWSSRVKVTWTTPTFPFIDHFRIIVLQAGTLVFTGTAGATDTVWSTSTLQERVPYQIDVRVESTTGAIGSAGSTTITPQGKYILPGNVPSIKGFEAGGKVYLWWGAATDIDIWKYDIRYGPTSGSWATATVLDRIEGLSKVVEGIPAGTWRFYLTAIDSVGGFSPTPIYVDAAVTLDNSSFLLNEFEYRTPTLSGLATTPLRGDSIQYVTDSGDLISYGHTNTDNTADDFVDASNIVTQPFDTPRSGGTATYTSNAWDIGMVISGNATFIVGLTVDSGTATTYIDTSLDGTTWTATAGTSAKGTFRFVRGRVTSTGTFSITGYPRARIDAIPRTETFQNLTSLSSGGYRVNLLNKYAKTKAITITPHGTTAKTFTADNIVLGAGQNYFDVYIFGLPSGAQVSSVFDVTYEGI